MIINKDTLSNRLNAGEVVKYQDDDYPMSSSKEDCAFFLMVTKDKNNNSTLSYFQVPQGYKMPPPLEKKLTEELFPDQKVAVVNVGTLERLKQSSPSIHAIGEYAIQCFSDAYAERSLKASTTSAADVLLDNKKRSLIATFFGAPKNKSTSPSIPTDHNVNNVNEVKLKK